MHVIIMILRTQWTKSVLIKSVLIKSTVRKIIAIDSLESVDHDPGGLHDEAVLEETRI